MKRKAIQWALLVAVLALIGAGAIILVLTPPCEPDGVLLTWGGIALSALCFALGLWLGHFLDKRNLLPE